MAKKYIDVNEVKDLEDGFYAIRNGIVYKLNLPIADPFKNAKKVKVPVIQVQPTEERTCGNCKHRQGDGLDSYVYCKEKKARVDEYNKGCKKWEKE